MLQSLFTFLKYKIAKALYTGSSVGYENVREAFVDLLIRYEGKLNNREIFVIRDDTGHYFADIKKPSKGIVINSFVSPF